MVNDVTGLSRRENTATWATTWGKRIPIIRANRQAMVRPASLAASFLALALSAFACSSSESTAVTPTGGADAGVVDPQKAEDVPAVAIQASTDDCPAAYQGKAPAPGWNRGFEVAGQKRDFWAIFPEGDSTTPAPVFMAYNGTSENGQAFAERADLAAFAKRGFVVLAPSSVGNGAIWPIWDSMRAEGDENKPNKDVEFVETLLKCAAAHRPLDKNRVYTGGHSAGGIFTNHIIQRKSELFAGAIVASGVFTQTSPTPEPVMDKMLVLVTWGGDNDKYIGKAGDRDVTDFSFVPEASSATKFYNNQKNVGQANCKGKNLGHAWLSPINDWMIDLLLAHPKGFPGAGALELAPVPATGRATCTTEPFTATASITISCGASTTANCQNACQLFADCGAENASVAGVLKKELAALGIAGTNCGGCIKRCEEKATAPVDAEVLDCMKTSQKTECAQGIAGAFPLIDAVNICCKGKSTSNYCKDVCTVIKGNGTALGYFATCQEF